MTFPRLTKVLSADTLAMLHRVYSDVLSTVLENTPPLDDAEESAWQDKIGALVIDADAAGEHDPEMLKHLALARLIGGIRP